MRLIDQLYKIEMSTFSSRENGITYPILAKFARDVFASLAQLRHLSLQLWIRIVDSFKALLTPNDGGGICMHI